MNGYSVMLVTLLAKSRVVNTQTRFFFSNLQKDQMIIRWDVFDKALFVLQNAVHLAEVG